MAESAALLLKVGLDLNHFRRELSRASSELAGQPITVGIKIDRSKIVSEFQLLNRYLGNKTFRATIETNLSAEIDKARKLAEALKNIPAGGGASGAVGIIEKGFAQKAYKAISPENIKKLYRAAADAGLLAFNETIANNKERIIKELANVGQSSIAGLLNGLTSGDAKIRDAAASLGKILIATIKSELGIASPSKETGKLGKFAAEGFEKGFVAGMIKAERAIAQAVSNAVIGAIYEGLTTVGNIAPAFVPLERALATQIRQSFQRAMRDGMKESIKPGIQGGLLGLLGGGMTGAALGGARALSGATTAGLSTLGSGGKFEIAKQLGRLTIGDTSGLTNFVQEAANQAIHQAFSTGTLGALLGAAAVSGVAGSSGFVRGAIGSLTRQILEGIADRILAGIASITSGDIGPATGKLAQAIINVLARDLEKRVQSMNIAFPSMLPALPPAYRGLPQAGGNAFGALPPAYRGLPPGRTIPMLPPAYRGLPMGGFDFAAMGAMPKGGASDDPGGKIVSLESGFIVAMRERFARAAERYLFGVETQVLDLYDAANAAVRVKIDRAIARLEAQIGARRTPSVFVRDLGAPVQPLLAGGNLPPRRLALPAAGESGGMLGTFTTVTGGGVTPKGGFPSEGPLFMGKQGPASLLSPSYFDNVKRFNAALDISRASLNAFRASQFPLVGGLRELGGEFTMATKQVLLYGTAYKGLAFISGLPGQILNAAKSQQQYTNALQTATQGTGTFAKELLYVDNVQRAFGLNLETTRTGFTRLYASMAPADFDSGSIEKLFTGISAATAALQLTPDKAERVIYAFGQMASKGQIMSEELKGQLGDVLPGALAIFAKAAGMSVKQFSKAMEDGVFVGGKFREVFAKVSDELMTRFGTGAQVAGKSLQGLLNTVGGNFQRTLESFAPLANTAAQAILGPLGNALRQLSTSAQIAMGEMERVQGQLSTARQDVSSLRAGGASADQIRAAEQNVVALEARYRALNEALKDPAVAKQVKDLQLLVQELSKAGMFVMNVATTIGSMLAPALNFLGTNLTSVIATITAFYIGFQTARLAAMALMGVLLLYRGLSALLGFGAAAQQATALAGAFNVLGVAATRATTQMVGLRLALTALVASTVVGAVVAGIVMIAGAFATMSDKAKDAAQSSRDAAKAAIDAAAAGNVAGAAMSVQTVLAESRKAAAARKALQSIYARATPEQKRGVAPMAISSQESVALQGTALTSSMIQAGVSRDGARRIRVPSGLEMRTIERQFGSLAGQQAIDLREAKEAQRQAEEVNKLLGLNKPMPGSAPSEAPSGGASKPNAAERRAADKAAKEAAQLAEEIKRQAMAASDALFAEQQRLVILQQTNPIAKAFAEYTSKDLTIQRELNKALAEAKSEKEKGDRRETARLQQSANALELEQAMKSVREDAVRSVEDLLKGQREQLQYEEDVKQLLTEGILPERARQVAEVRKLIRTQLDALDLSIQQAEAALKERESREGSTDAVKKLREELEKLKKARGDVADRGKQAEAGVPAPTETTKSPMDYIKDAAGAAQEELNKLTNWGYQAAQGANAVGSAFGKAFADIASGAQSADQALATAFQSIASHFFDMAAQIITQMITMYILKTLLGMFGGGGGFSSGGGGFSSGAAGFGGSFDAGIAPLSGITDFSEAFKFAEGGFVTGPTQALIGEAGESEYVIPASKMRGAMARYNAGARGNAVIPADGGEGISSMSMGAPVSLIDVRYSVERINSVDYVTVDQFRAGMAQAAQQGATQGEQRTLRRLQQSRATRSRLGMN